MSGQGESNLPELLRDMATQLVYADKAKNGPPPVEESIPWQAADEIERLRQMCDDYRLLGDAHVEAMKRVSARCAELEKALRRARETLDCAGYRTTDMKNEIKRIDADLATLQGQDNG